MNGRILLINTWLLLPQKLSTKISKVFGYFDNRVVYSVAGLQAPNGVHPSQKGKVLREKQAGLIGGILN